MATRAKPYESFGPYILFKKLDDTPLGDLWRAGKIEPDSIRAVALHRLTAGNAEALRQSALFARDSNAFIAGNSIVRSQTIDLVAGVPVISHDYHGGRSLQHVVVKARTAPNPQPIPTEQALAIAEKVATAVELVHSMKREGLRLVHGAVIPHFVWIEDDGEIRTGGQQLGRGLLASLAHSAIAKELAAYVAPEVRTGGQPTAAGDIYSVGAILYLVLTGKEPPDPHSRGHFTQALSQSVQISGESIPTRIRTVLQKALAPDPAGRYGSAADLRRELGALLHGGEYAPTTFNLAFYLHHLFKKEYEGEAVEREKESKVTPALYVAEAPPAAALESRAAPAVLTAPERRSRVPLIASGVVLLAAASFGAYYVLTHGGSGTGQEMQVARKASPPPRVTPQVVTAVSSDTVTQIAIDTPAAQAERKRRIEEAVQRRLQKEMMKLQAQYERDLEQRPAPAEPARERPAPLLGRVEPQQIPEPVATTTTVEPLPVREELPRPVVTTTTVAPTTTQPPPQPVRTETVAVAPSIREGDLVGINQVDQMPKPRSEIRPVYPPIALRQRLEATIFLSALISESGQVLEVKVLRGDPRRVGFDEAAIRAIRSITFTPALKDGKPVRTWLPIPIRFRP